MRQGRGEVRSRRRGEDGRGEDGRDHGRQGSVMGYCSIGGVEEMRLGAIDEVRMEEERMDGIMIRRAQ